MSKEKIAIKHFFLPYLKLNKFSVGNYYKKLPKNSIIFGRFKNDFQSNCFLYKLGKLNSISGKDIKFLKQQGFKLCYSYEVFDFENREFTINGYKKIRSDVDRIISSGFDYICVSNPYIIEIICNEYKKKINLVVSANLEINSPRGKLFFDLLNDTSSISHYYNVLYGYYNKGVREYLRNFINENIKYFKNPRELIYMEPGLSYKIGEIIAKSNLVLKNLNAFFTNKFEAIEIIDFIFMRQK